MAQDEFSDLRQIEQTGIHHQCIFSRFKRRDAALLVTFVALGYVRLKVGDISR